MYLKNKDILIIFVSNNGLPKLDKHPSLVTGYRRSLSNWYISALQCCIGFCYTKKWISYVVSVLSLRHVWLFEIPWTVAARIFCPWVFPGKPTGVGYMCMYVCVYMCIYTYICVSSLLHLPHPTPLGHPRALNWAPCAVQLLPTSQLFYASQSLPLHLQEAKLRAHLLCNKFRRRELRRSQLHTTNFSFLTWQCVKSRFNPSAKEYEGGELPEGLCSTFVELCG